MLDQTPHQTNAVALEETSCLRVDRDDILILLQQKPHAGMDMLTVLGKQFHAAGFLDDESQGRLFMEPVECLGFGSRNLG